MADPKKIFRKVSLERLSSPDQLDELVRVTTPKGWIALIAVGVLIVFAIIWGIVGEIPTKVYGTTKLVRGSGIAQIVAPVSGRVVDIAVREGDTVYKGQIIATIAQADLLNDIFLLRRQLKELEHNTNIQMGTWEKEKTTLKKQIKVKKQRMKEQKFLHKKGLIVKNDYLTTQHELNVIRDRLDEYKVKEDEARNKLTQLKRKIQTQYDQLKNYSRVVSRYSGRVVEVDVKHDNLVKAGDPVIKVERTGPNIKEIEALIFVSPLQGKQVKPGMKVLISPSYIQKQEFGSLVARVISVAKYPASPEYLNQLLQNTAEVQQLQQENNTFLIKADLVVDPKTESGYKWTSAKGPPINIQTGTQGTAEITVRTQRPITLVIPIIKGYMGYK